MTGMQIILGLLIFALFVGGAAVIGFSMTRAVKQERPKLLLIGFGVLVSGMIFGYFVVELFLVLEGRGH